MLSYGVYASIYDYRFHLLVLPDQAIISMTPHLLDGYLFVATGQLLVVIILPD